MNDERRSGPTHLVRRLYVEARSSASRTVEEIVSRGSLGELTARLTENVVAVTKIGADMYDLIVRDLRLAGRHDVTRLARQLARTEDKVELVLQEVEGLREALGRSRSSGSE